MSLVYLNGEFLPVERACVPVMDRGFLFGDGVYEVFPSFGGRLFRLSQHLERLNDSLRAIRIDPPHSLQEWEEILIRLILPWSRTDLSIYLQVTRGVASKRDHTIPPCITPTVFVMATPIPPGNAESNARGVAAITREDFRWGRCDIKAITLLANVLLRQEAADQGALEAILIRNGLATEGAASNLFMVQDGTLITPPKGPHLLPGITRDLVLELAAAQGIPHMIANIPVTDLARAEEIWLTSSVREIMPVIRLNGVPVGVGIPGPHWQRINQLYQGFKADMRGERGR